MLKKIIIGLSLVVFSGATSANAAVLSFGVNQGVDPGDIHVDPSFFTFDLGTDLPPASSFYEFTANFTGGVNISVTPNQASGTAADSWIGGLFMTWDDASDGFGNGIATRITNDAPDGGDAASVTGGAVTFFHNIVSGGVYRLFVTADAIHPNGGGGYSLVVSAVPLPPAVIAFSTAMLGVGFLARRRRKQKALFS